VWRGRPARDPCPCHPERRGRFAQRTVLAVEGPWCSISTHEIKSGCGCPTSRCFCEKWEQQFAKTKSPPGLPSLRPSSPIPSTNSQYGTSGLWSERLEVTHYHVEFSAEGALWKGTPQIPSSHVIRNAREAAPIPSTDPINRCHSEHARSSGEEPAFCLLRPVIPSAEDGSLREPSSQSRACPEQSSEARESTGDLLFAR
jgi:hypothetical protein